jgi:hypothetical protein
MLTTSNEASEPAPQGYAATHCRNCKAGWTRIGEKGGALTICLLDREKVMAGIVDCDRYELRDQKELG